MSEWISVKDRLPDYDTPVLIHGSHGGIYTAKYKENGWWKLNSHDHRCSPTHWMPLPPVPKEE